MGDYFYYKTEQGGPFQSALLQASNYPEDQRVAGQYWFSGYQQGSEYRVPPEGEPNKTFSFSSRISPSMYGNVPDQVDATYAALWDLGCDLDFSNVVAGDKDNLYLIASVKFENCTWAIYGCDIYNTPSDRIFIMYGFLITEETPNKIKNTSTAIRTTIYGTQTTWSLTERKYRLMYLSLYAGEQIPERTYGSLHIMSYGGQPSYVTQYADVADSGFFLDTELLEQYGNFSDTEEGNTDYGNYSGGGGYGGGTFDDSSDSTGLPTLPSLGVSQAGFCNVYQVTTNELSGFVDDLFPDFEPPSASQKEGLEAVAENLANTVEVIADFANSYINRGLVDYVLDCHIVPVAPATSANSGLKVGFRTFNYNPAKVTSDYVEVDCGTLSIKEYYQNFLDYEGTRAKLYLPFVGFVDVKPEWWQSGSIRVVYHFNVIDGSCIAFVIGTSSKSKLSDTVVATFGGNCCVHMPITGLNYSSMISGVVASSGKIASSVATGNVGGAVDGVGNLLGSRPTLEQSNGYNAGMSFMCYRRPYLLIERPVASFSKNYPHEQGLPLNVTKKLSTLSGFTKVSNANLEGILCNSEERNMIQTALAEGIIL